MKRKQQSKSLERLIYEELDGLWRERTRFMADHDAHEAMWGTPCGPTLSMVNPPVPTGITVLHRARRVYVCRSQ